MCTYICICLYVYLYVCIYVCLYNIYTHMHAYTQNTYVFEMKNSYTGIVVRCFASHRLWFLKNFYDPSR